MKLHFFFVLKLFDVCIELLLAVLVQLTIDFYVSWYIPAPCSHTENLKPPAEAGAHLLTLT
jgi:hypothetical protein